MNENRPFPQETACGNLKQAKFHLGEVCHYLFNAMCVYCFNDNSLYEEAKKARENLESVAQLVAKLERIP